MVSYDRHDSVSNTENQVPSEIRKNDVNLQAQVKPLPIYGLASDLTPTLRNHCGDSYRGSQNPATPRGPGPWRMMSVIAILRQQPSGFDRKATCSSAGV